MSVRLKPYQNDLTKNDLESGTYQVPIDKSYKPYQNEFTKNDLESGTYHLIIHQVRYSSYEYNNGMGIQMVYIQSRHGNIRGDCVSKRS